MLLKNYKNIFISYHNKLCELMTLDLFTE